jgi:hypothetical protein
VHRERSTGIEPRAARVGEQRALACKGVFGADARDVEADAATLRGGVVKGRGDDAALGTLDNFRVQEFEFGLWAIKEPFDAEG